MGHPRISLYFRGFDLEYHGDLFARSFGLSAKCMDAESALGGAQTQDTL